MARSSALVLRSLVSLWLLLLTEAGYAANGFSVTRLRDNVFAVMRNDPPGFAVESNSGFIECANHVVVIDAQSNDATTTSVLSEIRLRTAKPVRYLINTHWHDDHIIRNRVYRDAFPQRLEFWLAHALASAPSHDAIGPARDFE